MKKIATIALVAAGTFGFAGVSMAEGCNWGAKSSHYTAEADMTPIPEKAVAVAEAPDATDSDVIVKNETETTEETTVVAQAPITE
ncbi:MAG: hypothetical protein AAGD23_11880 [Pseudomonadota bacterium]